MLWHRFSIFWEKLFLEEHGEQCLPFSCTRHFTCIDGIPLNKARNFQEVDVETGLAVCTLINEELCRLTEVRARRHEARESRLPRPFLEVEHSGGDWQQLWAPVLKRVSELGELVLACAFGSQRYNLHTEHSDMDMFIVYQAPTTKLLGFQPPALTIKVSPTEYCSVDNSKLNV